MSVVKSSADQISQTLVNETFKLIDGQSKDPIKAHKMALMFLARFAGVLLYRSLTEAAPEGCNTKEKILKFTMANFSATKLSVQEAVAAAFTGAMNTYSGQPIEYFCQVKPVGPVLNKEPI